MRVAVISGAEEARLIRLGALQAVPAYDQRHLVIDIGGGSTEFIIGEGDEVLGARSLKLGAIRLTERFGLEGPVKRKALEECRQFIRSYLAPVARMVKSLGYEVAVGSSGTIVNLAEMARRARRCTRTASQRGDARRRGSRSRDRRPGRVRIDR